MIPSAAPPALPELPSSRGEPGAIVPRAELVEVLGAASGSVLAAGCALVQGEGEPVAWIAAGTSMPHPADLARAGVDCDRLVVVRASGPDSARAAEILLASGGFGLVVVDGCGHLRDRSVARLRALCRKHRARLLVAPHAGARGAPALGATVALRLVASLDGRALRLRWAKDKAGLGAPLPTPTLGLPAGAVSPRPPAEVARLRPRPSRNRELVRVGATA